MLSRIFKKEAPVATETVTTEATVSATPAPPLVLHKMENGLIKGSVVEYTLDHTWNGSVLSLKLNAGPGHARVTAYPAPYEPAAVPMLNDGDMWIVNLGGLQEGQKIQVHFVVTDDEHQADNSNAPHQFELLSEDSVVKADAADAIAVLDAIATTDSDATTDAFATTDAIATTDAVATTDVIATTEAMAMTDAIPTTDAIATTNAIATPDAITTMDGFATTSVATEVDAKETPVTEKPLPVVTMPEMTPSVVDASREQFEMPNGLIKGNPVTYSLEHTYDGSKLMIVVKTAPGHKSVTAYPTPHVPAAVDMKNEDDRWIAELTGFKGGDEFEVHFVVTNDDGEQADNSTARHRVKVPSVAPVVSTASA